MNRRSIFLAVPLVLAALAAGFFWGRARGQEPDSKEEAAKDKVTATVQVAAMTKGALERQRSAFGTIVPAPGAAQTLAVAYECRIVSIAVSEGQVVAAGAPLLVVTDSPDALLALDQARIDEQAAQTLLQQTRTRHGLRLADNGQLAQAEQAFNTAQARLKSLEARHSGLAQGLRAKVPGVVTRIPVQVGAVLPPGSSLLELADTRRLEARLGVEPEDATQLRAGGLLTLSAVNGGAKSAQVRIRTVSPALNPATHLVDVFVTLAQGHPFMLGQ